MWLTIYYIFCYLIFGYTLFIMLSYLFLAVQSWRAQHKMKIDMPSDETIKFLLRGSPLTPGVSIIAPAYNEEVTIIDNVYSLMQIDYPNYEIIIVNDESTDRTMELLINEFSLVEVPYDVAMKVPSKPIKRVLKSTDERFSKLVVVDKAHGGRKSDGSNAGVNVCSNKYFVCTDVDCIVEPMALYRMMWHVVNSHDPMIGVSATMLMSNGCVVENGRVVEAKVPRRPLPMFQQLEYMRSFLIGKLGWSTINALPNISGGFGLFDTDVVVKSGGYDQTSMAEDVDMLLRMVTYMKNSGHPFCVAQVPQVCCWTEGPSTLKALYRQRVRWARGLFEIVSNHRKLFFNPHYGPIGAFTLPYILMFEFIAPVLEMGGFLFMIWLLFIGGINWDTAFIIFGMIYLFSVLMAFFVLIFDYSTRAVEWKSTPRSYMGLIFASVIEPFIYHPIITFCSNVGYWRYLTNATAVWKPIQRRGVKKKASQETSGETPASTSKAGTSTSKAGVLKTILVALLVLIGSMAGSAQEHASRFYVDRAEGYAQSNQWNEAKRVVDEGLADWPDDPDLRYLNGRFYYITGHLDKARYNLVRAVQVNDQHFKAKRVLVDVEDGSKHYSSAICYVNELLEFQPYDKDLWRRKIGLYRKMNNHVEADAALERLARIYPNDTIIRNDLRNRRRENANTTMLKNSLEEAASELEKWIEGDPNNLSYYLDLISIYQRMGEFERAIGVANRGLLRFPRNTELLKKGVGILSDMGLYTQAFALARKNAPHSIIYNSLLQDVATDARLKDPYEVHARLYDETHDRDALTYLLNTSLTRGYYDDAIVYLREAMRRDGRTAPLLMKQYALEKRMGNAHGARKLLEELYAQAPTDEEITAQYADMMLALATDDMAQQQWTDANLHLQRALELMSTDHEAWPAAVSRRITCLGHLGLFDQARVLYRQAAVADPDNQRRYASAYEDMAANNLHQLIEDEHYDRALSEAQSLLGVVPRSEVALRCCINMSQTLKRNDLFYDYARQGYEAYPDVPYFAIKQAVALQQQNRNAEALALVSPRRATDDYASPMLTAANSGISQEWAAQLLKNHIPDLALQVVDSALVHDASNRELLYTKGVAYELLKQFDQAYKYQKRYYEPSNAEQPEYFEHMRYLGFRALKNRVDATYTYASYDTRQDELASHAHLYSVATVSYSRVEKKNTYTGQVSYKGIDGYHADGEHEAGGTGLELMAQWDHTFASRWSGSANVAWSTRFFNKVGANLSLSCAMNDGWTPSLRLGYRRTPETYLYLGAGDSTAVARDKYNLFVLTPQLEKSWERIKVIATLDLTSMESSLYYNIGMKGKLFFNDDNISSVALLAGFGSFPELTFFEQTALRGISHTNTMVGFDAQYLCTRHLYVGLSGSWNTCFSPYRMSDGTLRDSYRNIYSLSVQLHVAF